MRRLVERSIREEDAQDLAEYGVALALIAGFVVAVAIVIAGNVQTLWSNAQETVSQVVANES